MGPVEIILIILAVVVFIVIICSIKVVRQSTVVVVERLGKFRKILETGIHFVLPFFEKASKPISLKERVADFAPQPVITKDNVTMQIDTVVYFQVTDAKLFTYGVEDPIRAIENLTATTLRNLVGELELDGTLTLRAEGEKRSNILVAEGEKEAMILRAEAKKAAVIAEAEATATAIQMINDANPNAAYLTLQGYEALKSVANGKSTKLIVPSEIQNVSGLLASMKEVVSSDKGETDNS